MIQNFEQARPVKYRVHYPVGSPQIIEADSYKLENGWHKFECYEVNRMEPYWRHFSDDVTVEKIEWPYPLLSENL
jgi:hypothetical protein